MSGYDPYGMESQYTWSTDQHKAQDGKVLVKNKYRPRRRSATRHSLDRNPLPRLRGARSPMQDVPVSDPDEFTFFQNSGADPGPSSSPASASASAAGQTFTPFHVPTPGSVPAAVAGPSSVPASGSTSGPEPGTASGPYWTRGPNTNYTPCSNHAQMLAIAASNSAGLSGTNTQDGSGAAPASGAKGKGKAKGKAKGKGKVVANLEDIGTSRLGVKRLRAGKSDDRKTKRQRLEEKPEGAPDRCDFCQNHPIGQQMYAQNRECDCQIIRTGTGRNHHRECQHCADFRQQNPGSNHACIVGDVTYDYKKYAQNDPATYADSSCAACIGRNQRYTCDVDCILGIKCSNCRRDYRCMIQEEEQVMKRPAKMYPQRAWFRRMCDRCFARKEQNKNVSPYEECSWLSDRTSWGRPCNICERDGMRCLDSKYAVAPETYTSSRPEEWKFPDEFTLNDAQAIELSEKTPFRPKCSNCSGVGNHIKCRVRFDRTRYACERCTQLGVHCALVLNQVVVEQWPIFDLSQVGFGQYTPYVACSECKINNSNCDRQRPCDECTARGRHCDVLSAKGKMGGCIPRLDRPGAVYYLALGYGPTGTRSVKTGLDLYDWIGPFAPLYGIQSWERESEHLWRDVVETHRAYRPPRGSRPPHGAFGKAGLYPSGEILDRNDIQDFTPDVLTQMILNAWPTAHPPGPGPQFTKAWNTLRQKQQTMLQQALQAQGPDPAYRITGSLNGNPFMAPNPPQPQSNQAQSQWLQHARGNYQLAPNQALARPPQPQQGQQSLHHHQAPRFAQAQFQQAQAQQPVNPVNFSLLQQQQYQAANPHGINAFSQQTLAQAQLHQQQAANLYGNNAFTPQPVQQQQQASNSYGDNPFHVQSPQVQAQQLQQQGNVFAQQQQQQQQQQPGVNAPASTAQGEDTDMGNVGMAMAFDFDDDVMRRREDDPDDIFERSMRPDIRRFDPRVPRASRRAGRVKQTSLAPIDRAPEDVDIVVKGPFNPFLGFAISKGEKPRYNTRPRNSRWKIYNPLENVNMKHWHYAHDRPAQDKSLPRLFGIVNGRKIAPPSHDVLHDIPDGEPGPWLRDCCIEPKDGAHGYCGREDNNQRDCQSLTHRNTSPHRFPVCGPCARSSIDDMFRPGENPITKDELMGMRAYLCNDCAEHISSSAQNAAQYHAIGARRIYGAFADGETPKGIYNPDGIPAHAVEFKAGLKSGTGCSCADKVLGGWLCRFHRLYYAEEALKQAALMREWRLSLFKKPVCPACLARKPLSEANASADHSGFREGCPTAWACLTCTGWVVNQKNDENNKPRIIPLLLQNNLRTADLVARVTEVDDVEMEDS
ncbi:hypothetical protein FZEAL_9747 [Fusarium zealandicum]|uniref:Zn(2)-C6 fungal-type domain-containing protein n=1 Tax=Fusarium zealandicum TaxID=1053134 RepID=A0A8H4XF48_9HYPO|nr:hypothetical protein FZEAL_9747 [Fusarium zealandicum]